MDIPWIGCNINLQSKRIKENDAFMKTKIYQSIAVILLVFLQLYSNGQSTNWTEERLKKHWKEIGADELEGIYSKEVRHSMYFNNRIVHNVAKIVEERYYIIKNKDGYILSNFLGEYNALLTKTYSPSSFLMSTKVENFGIPLNETVTARLIKISSSELDIDNYKYILDDDEFVVISDAFTMLYKPENEPVIKNEAVIKKAVSGTGFAITSNGIIATNYHVIEEANSIKIRGVNSDFNKTYNAKVLVSDKNNDLALIQIDDYGFTSTGVIPYTIKTSISSVGENVFVLGYPLRATMGDEIKLTNGIISSKTGFQGDVTAYQISAPVQPGNSGGPVFDSRGNLIGIVNAKLVEAENAAYAIKTSYLSGLLELLSTPPKLQTVNSLTDKTLPSQVEIIKKLVFIIETN